MTSAEASGLRSSFDMAAPSLTVSWVMAMADVTAVCCSLVSMILSDSNSLVALSMNVDAVFVIPFAVGHQGRQFEAQVLVGYERLLHHAWLVDRLAHDCSPCLFGSHSGSGLIRIERCGSYSCPQHV